MFATGFVMYVFAYLIDLIREEPDYEDEDEVYHSDTLIAFLVIIGVLLMAYSFAQVLWLYLP